MNGTSYGACVLNVAPESFVGGPLGLVHDSDMLNSTYRDGASTSTSATKKWHAAKRCGHRPTRAKSAARLDVHPTIRQANEGCDFDFLEAGEEVDEPDIN